MRLNHVLVILLGISAVSAGPDYSEPGRYATAFRVVDIPGGTELMRDSRIYYPDSTGVIPGEAAPAPVIVFGHGWQMGIDRYLSYAEHFASWGFIAVLPTYSNPVFRPEHDRRARLMADAARFAAALDTVTGDPFEARVARERWGFCGHSLGGALSFLAADIIPLGDTLRAIAALASPQTSPPTDVANITAPMLVLPGGTDNIVPWPDSRAAFWQDGRSPGTFAVISGANHGYFMDYSYFWENGGSAGISREEQQRVSRRWLTALFERYLHDDESDWNFAWLYGDSLRASNAFDSVEVRLPSVAVGDRPTGSWPPFTVRPNPFSNHTRVSGPGSREILVYDATGSLVGRKRGPLVGGSLQPGVYFLREEATDNYTVRIVKLR